MEKINRKLYIIKIFVFFLLLKININFSINPHQAYKLDKGMPIAYLLKILGNRQRILSQKKRPWRETIRVIEIVNSLTKGNNTASISTNILTEFSSVLVEITHMRIGANFLNKVEDIQFFQKSSKLVPRILLVGEVEECSFFKKNLFGSFVMGAVYDQLPFLTILTNKESEENQGHWVYKYYFSNGYINPTSGDRRIIIVSVSDDKVEEVKTLPTLFQKQKIDFILALEDMNFYKKLNMGYFLKVLELPLHYDIFANNCISFTYADEKVCPHQIQRVAFIVHFDKNLITSAIDVIYMNICSKCNNFYKSSYLFDQVRYQLMANGLLAINFCGSIDYFYEKMSYDNIFFYLKNYSDFDIVPEKKIRIDLVTAKKMLKNLCLENKKISDWQLYKSILMELTDENNTVTLKDINNTLICEKKYISDFIIEEGLRLQKKGKNILKNIT